MNASFSGPLWHVAAVESRAEIDVAEAIHDELGFTVFVPAERVWTVKRGRRVAAERPLFSGYIFPQVDPYRQDWQRLLDIDGVMDVLGRPVNDVGRPSHVPTAWVDLMQKCQARGVFDRTTATPEGFKVGEHVRVSEGPYAGFAAEIEGFVAKMRSATARKRAKLLIAFMGRMVRLELDVTQVEKV